VKFHAWIEPNGEFGVQLTELGKEQYKLLLGAICKAATVPSAKAEDATVRQRATKLVDLDRF